jgi:hypothetical protein
MVFSFLHIYEFVKGGTRKAIFRSVTVHNKQIYSANAFEIYP